MIKALKNLICGCVFKNTATVALVGIPADWDRAETVAGVWSEFARFQSDLTAQTNSIRIPIRGRFIQNKWRFVFLAERRKRKLIIWKGSPENRKKLNFDDGSEVPFRLLSKWEGDADDNEILGLINQLAEQDGSSNGG